MIRQSLEGKILLSLSVLLILLQAMTVELFVLLFCMGDVVGILQPTGSSGSWTSLPVIHTPSGSRSTTTTILLSWTPGEHSIETISHYEIQARFPTEIADSDQVVLPLYGSVASAYPQTVVDNREWAVSWSPWYTVYSGLGRQFLFNITNQFSGVGIDNQRFFDFQVRAITVESGLQSAWSDSVQGHTVLEGDRDRLLLELIGTGRNNVGFTKVVVGGNVLLNRADMKGLTLIVLDRRDLSVAFFQTYNTFDFVFESSAMAQKIRLFGPKFFILVVSSGAWEWHATPTLTDALEYYGAYYVGQWSRVFAGTSSVQFSPYADLAETASEDSFGHPYAFFGYYGLGAGGGYESLQLNTGHYLATGKAEHAIIRLELYYSYMMGRYMVGTNEGKFPLSSDFFVKGQAPRPKTVHAPLPSFDPPVNQIQPIPAYSPYIGSLWAQLEYIMESNQTYTVPEYNVTNDGFEMVQRLLNRPAQVSSDPRRNVVTELERIWGGPSLRYSSVTGNLISSSAATGTTRVCPDILLYRLAPGFTCPAYDTDATVGIPLLQFGIGMWPTICDHSSSHCGDPIPTSFSPLIPKPIDITDINSEVTVITDTWT